MQAVAWCVQHLTESSPAARDTVRENGTLPLLVGVLKTSADVSARERAAWAICNTATQNAENKAAFRSGALALPLKVGKCRAASIGYKAKMVCLLPASLSPGMWKVQTV